MARKPKRPKGIDAYDHDDATRLNTPTAELSGIAEAMEDSAPMAPVRYARDYPLAEGETRDRDADFDPQIIWDGAKLSLTDEQITHLLKHGTVELGHAQLTWRGKDQQDWSDLVVNVPPIYVQETVKPEAIIAQLKRATEDRREKKAIADGDTAPDLFADVDTQLPPDAVTEFYQHDVDWKNRLILGDSLQVMASLAERERLRGKVQCIYFDPPYGIKFNSNWQVSTRSRDVKDGKLDSVTREPEQVKAFRDTWKDGIHSYLTYLRDRMTVARDLLTESGSIFVQIGDENVHRVRALMDEVFGEENFSSLISYKTSIGLGSQGIDNTTNFLVWYYKDKTKMKFRAPLFLTTPGEAGASRYKTVRSKDMREHRVSDPASYELDEGSRFYRDQGFTSRSGSKTTIFAQTYNGKEYSPKTGGWRTASTGMSRAVRSDRVLQTGKSLSYRKYHCDFNALAIDNFWADVSGGVTSRSDPKVYVVQTGAAIVQRCILMTTDPGDLVLDPTCGSGTTATVGEQWGRRWVTIDTSRVALALARTRIMSARYPYYHLADTPEGRDAEMKLTGKTLPDVPTHGDIRQGFVYERAPHITLKSIANNADIDTIWERYEEELAPLREAMTAQLPEGWLKAYREEQNYDVEVGPEIEEWEIPRELPQDKDWNDVDMLHRKFWKLRIDRQTKIDESIAQAADVEMLYDRPVEDKTKVRVAGPFTVESLSPHRIIPIDDQEDDILEALGPVERARRESSLVEDVDYVNVILENLRTHGAQSGNKDEKIDFVDVVNWNGVNLHAEGVFIEDADGAEIQRRVGIQIGPEYGALRRADVAAAAREAQEAGFDMLLSCAFAFDAHASDLTRLGPLRILKVKMNPDLHMADDLKNTGSGNLFLIVGEPDISDPIRLDDGRIQIELRGMDVFVPRTGEIRSNELKDIAAWFIDTDYDEESFFVRHAYFLGGGSSDPYKSLKTALKAEIDKEAWDTLYRNVSRPFERPKTGRIAVKVINHFGDEVMRVMSV
jgi:adenine-specific DNA-methyltransferase